MSNTIIIPLVTLKGLRKLVELCTLNKIPYTVEDREDPYRVLIPEKDYRIWGLDQKEFE